MIYFKLYRTKILITQNFVNGNSNGYLNLAFLAQNGEGTVLERSEIL